MRLVALGFLLVGCAPTSVDRIVVATNWSEGECEPLAALMEPARIRWIRVGPHEDPTRILDRRAPVDVILGGPAASYVRLLVGGRILETNLQIPALPADSSLSPFLEAADRPGEWANHYARLIRGDASPGAMAQRSSNAAIVSGSAKPELARSLVEFIAGKPSPLPSRSLLFLPDLLHAALVSADLELLAAREAMAEADNPARTLSLLTEAPPWPPASIVKMRSRPDRDSLLKLLAGQIAPDPVARQWLLQSWNRPPQPLDGGTLDMLARAADGRLAAEPRFRSWLRSEWAAWCRQRYRRVVLRLTDARYAPP